MFWIVLMIGLLMGFAGVLCLAAWAYADAVLESEE